MPTFYDSRNQPHVLSNRLGSGGEGTVYRCETDFNVVAKVYHEPISAEKIEKLRWMAANKNERLLRVAAWVVDLLYDAPGGRAVGFLMPNVSAKEIHELYSLKSRRVYFPDATWHFLVNTAANLARAFYALHRDAHIMGDVNHGNCVVMRDGTVKLIDCDSYSIKTGEQRYACEVGVATHLAPELQGVDLRAVEREDKHDNFGLAVIVFQLLFLGRHPFAGNYQGVEDKSLEDCIREYRFAYGSNAQIKNVRQPPGTLPLSAASPRVALLFERAFLTEDRPEPREWIEALEDLAVNLEQCALHPGHLYFKELAACPWCEIETQTGLMLFPFITDGSHLSGEKPFNIFTVENLIASFGIENNRLALLPATLPKAILPPPSPEIIEAKENRRRVAFFVVPGYSFSLILMMLIFGVATGFYFGILLVVCSIYLLNSSHESASQPLAELLADNQRKLEKLERERVGDGVPQIIGDDLIKIRQKVNDYQTAQLRSVGELKALQTKTAQRELYKYLHSKSIANAGAFGIEDGERKRLIAVGIKTAAEIDENRLRYFYRVEEATILKLLDWHAHLAADFERDERAGKALEAEREKFAEDTNRERRQIERDIEQLLILLRGGAAHLQKRQRELFAESDALARQIAQTKSDLQALGSNIPAIIALILIALFFPLIGGALTGSTVRNQRMPPEFRRQNGYGSDSPQTAADYRKAAANLPDENMSDAEIRNLTDAQRDDYAERFYAEAVKYNYDEIDHRKAERYSRLAVRFARSDNPRFLNQLGYALYEQKEYDESLKLLKRSLSVKRKNSETEIFISMNYLATKKFDESIKLMSAVTKEYSSSFEAFYNLGLAYSGLNDYVRAEAAFRRAAEINPRDAGIHYHLGFCFYKLKKSKELRGEYETLTTLDKALAETLLADAKLDIKVVDSRRKTVKN